MGVREEFFLLSSLHKFLLVVWLCLSVPLTVHCQCNTSPVVFNFGDSNSDTGGFSDALGFSFLPPTGRTYFGRPAGRLSDGRLMIDFLCESLNSTYLTPYLESLGPNFTNGVNFAVGGSATLPRYKPFSLGVQVAQFIRFRTLSPALASKGHKDLVREENFQNALYTIDIGQNDLSWSFSYLPYAQVIEKIPSFITEIKLAIWDLYQHGGKNFWVHNTGPLGCLPLKLTVYGHNASELDENGCIQPLNDAAKMFNVQLRALCEELRSQMKNATIVYVDIYSIKFDLISNASKYGFQNPLMACCGYGGPPYNYNPNVACGQAGYNVCKEGSRYISWDGVHHTEAANAIFASKILSTNYSTPQVKKFWIHNTSLQELAPEELAIHVFPDNNGLDQTGGLISVDCSKDYLISGGC
ncbi:hypothetical protein SLE2022_241690 [Rubroshorea leprosula]